MKKIAAVFGILLLMFLIGCGKEEKTVKGPFIGGSQGIVSEFQKMGLEEKGVETVFENESFDVVVTLKNKGEADVEAGNVIISLVGIDTVLFGIPVSKKNNSQKLEKVSEFNTLGGEEDVSFGKARLANVLGYFDATFFTNIDYKYTTYVLVPKVCFKYDLNDKTVCDVEELKTVYASSAPIQVRTVKEDPAGNKKIALVFEIENSGGGRITIPNEDFLTRYDRLGFKLSEEGWDCKSGGSDKEARFTDNKATLRCVSPPLTQGTLYTKQITLTLNYIYRDIIQKTVRIKELINK